MKTMKINKLDWNLDRILYVGYDENQMITERMNSEDEVIAKGKEMGYGHFVRTYNITSSINGQPLFANRHYYTDVKPYEVVEVISDKVIMVRELDAELTEAGAKGLRDSFEVGGFFGHCENDAQEWKLAQNIKNPILKIRLHKNGAWYLAGDKGSSFTLADEPYKFYDYNF